jgi:hypothetical protein
MPMAKNQGVTLFKMFDKSCVEAMLAPEIFRRNGA